MGVVVGENAGREMPEHIASARWRHRWRPIPPPSRFAGLCRVEPELVGLRGKALAGDATRRLRFLVHAAGLCSRINVWLLCLVIITVVCGSQWSVLASTRCPLLALYWFLLCQQFRLIIVHHHFVLVLWSLMIVSAGSLFPLCQHFPSNHCPPLSLYPCPWWLLTQDLCSPYASTFRLIIVHHHHYHCPWWLLTQDLCFPLCQHFPSNHCPSSSLYPCPWWLLTQDLCSPYASTFRLIIVHHHHSILVHDDY